MVGTGMSTTIQQLINDAKNQGKISGLYLFTGIRYNNLMSGWIVHLRKSDRSHEKLK